MHGNWHDVVVDDANGVLLHGETDGEPIEGNDGEVRSNVWVYNDKPSGFGDTVGQIQLHQLKKNEHGHYVA